MVVKRGRDVRATPSRLSLRDVKDEKGQRLNLNEKHTHGSSAARVGEASLGLWGSRQKLGRMKVTQVKQNKNGTEEDLIWLDESVLTCLNTVHESAI
jgi:hypothetical protein